jgi:hypothetical protein
MKGRVLMIGVNVAVGERVKTHVSVVIDKNNKVIHVLDLDMGRTITNSIDEVWPEIFKFTRDTDNANSWEWILYHTDGHISLYDLSGGSFTNVELDESKLYLPFKDECVLRLANY